MCVRGCVRARMCVCVRVRVRARVCVRVCVCARALVCMVCEQYNNYYILFLWFLSVYIFVDLVKRAGCALVREIGRCRNDRY